MEIKNTYDELDVQEEYKHTEELSENINPLEENNGSDIPSVVFTKKITRRKQYNKLKDFLKEKGFILIWDEIDCGYDYYEYDGSEKEKIEKYNIYYQEKILQSTPRFSAGSTA